MPNNKKNKVELLISTLTKAEKRYFKLFFSKNADDKQPLFVELFSIYDQFGSLSDQKIAEEYPQFKKSQLPNIRRHLYLKLLTSLRLQNQKSNEEIEIRQQIDFARVLYDKGLYVEALQILNRYKVRAIEENKNLLSLEILFFEKAIESQNITKSIENRAQELIHQSNSMIHRVNRILNLSNLSLQLYAYFLKYGFCKSKQELSRIKHRFGEAIDNQFLAKEDFYSQVYFYQSRCWYFYIRQEFQQYYKETKRWLSVFSNNEKMKQLRSDFYLKSIHNVISASFINQKSKAFFTHYKLLNAYLTKNEKNLSWNEIGMAKLYIHMHELDAHFLRGNFSDYTPKVLKQLLVKNPYHWDAHRISVFQYKLGCLAFGQENYSEAIDHFNQVASHYKSNSKSMVFLFSKILLAFSHLQLNHIQLVHSLVQALQKDINKDNTYRPLEKELVVLLSRLSQHPKKNHSFILQESLDKINRIKHDPFTAIAFQHFYAIEWIVAKIEHTEAQEILARNFIAS